MNIKPVTCTDERQMANAIRALTMDAVQAARSGHPGMPMGMADVATVLFNRFMQIDPATPDWADRDRFVLSAGHGSMLLYAIHHLLGYCDMDMDQLRNFRQLGYRTAGHPEYGHAMGIETTTGPLGQGIATAVGMALAERMQNARFGDALVDHWTYVICGDGCLMEGISHEAIDMAGHLGLGRLVILWDDNAITIDGSTDLSTSMDQLKRFESARWHVQAIDGHAPEEIATAIEAAHDDNRPSLIACKTIIGYGSPNKQGTSATHGAPLGDEEIALTREALGWTSPAFEIPEALYDAWQETSARGAKSRKVWELRLAKSAKADEFSAALDGSNRVDITAAIDAHKAQLSKDSPKVATRKASEMVLEVINKTLPTMVGGSADLTGSNLTRTSAMSPITRDDYTGSYLYYGIREHGMTAAMNGIYLHGGLRPYGGTFLAFADYCRSSIRLSALMGLPVVYVMTHDSIGLGEDGPTHQPVEQIASLRAMPNVNVFRPADAVETAEAWECAIMNNHTPSILCLSRQDLPTLRNQHVSDNLSSRGAYVLRETEGARDITLIATGSEVEIAINAADELNKSGIKAAVVSAPCFELFESQSADYRLEVLGSAPRIGIEAAIKQGWGSMLGENSAFIGMTGFGASAPADQLYEKFNITVAETIKAVHGLL